ncbi:hypothetical protein [Ferrimonas balearica]|uniref:hypothetical protein n=1 Tax=Ferrimonas balearica TaxID=44012 RepID=UPI001C57103F|nr:hypothetical protein [Ferrimonas balearica]MBW3163806.1 hypothetical protein [Ferrimonas balearica]
MTALYEQMVYRPTQGSAVPQSGSLLVSADGVVFYGQHKVINLDPIRHFTLDNQGWLHIEYGDNRQASFFDGSWRGRVQRLTRLPALVRSLHQHRR